MASVENSSQASAAHPDSETVEPRSTRSDPADHLGEQSAPARQFAALTGVRIVSTGSAVPQSRITNADLVDLGYDETWIVQRTGIQERRRGAAGVATSDLAVLAARQCLDRAGVSADEVDLILVATMTPDQPTPSTACRVQYRLGSCAPALDLNAACAGFMYALVTGMHFVTAGTYRRVLVIGADMMSRTVNPTDYKTFPLFGDGAGAVLLGAAGEEQGFHAFTLGADGSGADLLCQPAGGTREPLTAARLAAGRHFLAMDGRAVFKWAIRLIHETAAEVLRFAELDPEEIDLVVFHQANLRILEAAIEALQIPRDRLFVNLDRYGNTSAGSIPLALDEACQEGKIGPGSKILLAGFGAGLTWGAGVFQW